jgi:phage protein D/phage baseplate assembly protein gpV
VPETTSALITQFHVKIDGAFVAEGFMRDVHEVSVQNSLHLPDVATIVINDPSLKWIDDALLAPGKPMEILGTPSQERSKSKPVFDGEIVELEPEFGAKTHRLTIRAFDRLHRLTRGRQVRSFQNVTDSDIAKRFAAEAGLQADVETTRQVHEYLFQNNETNLEFLRQRAASVGFLCYVSGKKLCFKKLAHASPAIGLNWGATLTEFRLRMTTIAQVNSVTARGWDPVIKREIVGEASKGEGMRSIGESKAGGTMAKDAFHIDAALLVSSHPIHDQLGADQIAKAVADRQAERFIEADGVCPGNPGIIAGASVKIESIGKRFGGEYFVTAATHRFTPKDGYTTSFSISGQTPSTLLRLLQKDEPSQATRAGLVIAIVTDNQDPMGWGRVKVKYPWLSTDHASDWARVVSVGGGAERGIMFLPEIDDEVLVGFEHGDVHHPYVLGGLWNGKDQPPKKNQQVVVGGKVNQRILKSRAGHMIVFDDSEGAGSVTIEDKNGNVMKLDSVSNALSIKAKGALSIKSDTTLTIEAVTISLKGSGMVKVEGGVIKLN